MLSSSSPRKLEEDPAKINRTSILQSSINKVLWIIDIDVSTLTRTTILGQTACYCLSYKCKNIFKMTYFILFKMIILIWFSFSNLFLLFKLKPLIRLGPFHETFLNWLVIDHTLLLYRPEERQVIIKKKKKKSNNGCSAMQWTRGT